ncbi:MAG TPA: PDZ domain-containing protein [Acidobacteriaceae bacterium]|jgi:S1-C subfamily serine protease|nr:PDZ domain-containing protein [Acidobacteriaceae bacterium]
MPSPHSRALRTLCLATLILIACLSVPLRAQVKIESINDEGVTAPCMGIGIGVLLERKCLAMVSQEGFVRQNEIGRTGMTLGTSGDQDGVITAIDSGSPADQAGLKIGDQVVAVDAIATRRTPGSIVEEQVFGAKGQTVQLHLRSGPTERDVELRRASWKPPSQPKSPGMLISLRPLMDWRGKWVPCMSAVGPSAVAVFAYCDSHYGKLGYVRASDLGTTGMVMDTTRTDAAVVEDVAPNSPAAAAGIHAGDVVVSVEGKALSASIGSWAQILLFGALGAKHTVTLQDPAAQASAGQRTVALTLAAPTTVEAKNTP